MKRPLDLELSLPLPPRLRFYVYKATQHPSERQRDTYRIQLTDAPRGGRSRFDRRDGVRPVLLGLVAWLDLFIIWDADVHDAGAGFAYSRGVQAPPDLVYKALAHGVSSGRRVSGRGGSEQIVVARRTDLITGLLRRIELSNHALTGDE